MIPGTILNGALCWVAQWHLKSPVWRLQSLTADCWHDLKLPHLSYVNYTLNGVFMLLQKPKSRHQNDPVSWMLPLLFGSQNDKNLKSSTLRESIMAQKIIYTRKMTHETLDHPPKFLDYLLTIKPPGGYIRDFTPEGFLMFITIVLISCLFFLFGLFCCLNLPWYRYTKVYTWSIITQFICPSL